MQSRVGCTSYWECASVVRILKLRIISLQGRLHILWLQMLQIAVQSTSHFVMCTLHVHFKTAHYIIAGSVAHFMIANFADCSAEYITFYNVHFTCAFLNCTLYYCRVGCTFHDCKFCQQRLNAFHPTSQRRCHFKENEIFWILNKTV